MKLPPTTSWLLMAAMAFVAAQATTAAVIQQPPDLNAGDRYRLVFVTSSKRDALSSDIADYDAFVQAAADAAPEVSTWGLEWQAIGSTLELNARNHIATRNGGSWPIYRLDGSRFAANYEDLWSGEFNIEAPSLVITELGSELEEQDDQGQQTRAWTGTQLGGARKRISDGSGALGTQPWVGYGAPHQVAFEWLDAGIYPATQLYHMYAISEVLVAVPEPASQGVVLLGLLFSLVVVARRRG